MKTILNKTAVALALLSLVLTCSASLLRAGTANPNDWLDDATPKIQTLVTNCPSITDVVMKSTRDLPWAGTPRTPRRQTFLYEFRMQKDAIFFRVTTNAFFAENLADEYEVGGVWKGDIWYYTTHLFQHESRVTAPRPILFTYSFSSRDHATQAHFAMKEALLVLGEYTTLGISSDGPESEAVGGLSLADPHSISWNPDGRLVWKDERHGMTATVTFVYSNSLPASASLLIIDGAGTPLVKNKVWYGYNPRIANGRLPSVITSNSGIALEIVSLEFSKQEEPLPESAFVTPSQILSAEGLETIVWTNGANFHLDHGELISMDGKAAERNLASPRSR